MRTLTIFAIFAISGFGCKESGDKDTDTGADADTDTDADSDADADADADADSASPADTGLISPLRKLLWSGQLERGGEGIERSRLMLVME